MQKLFLSILTVSILISCSSDSEPESNEFCFGEIDLKSQQFPQRWTLIKMIGNTPNSEMTGANMNWQETILLNSDSTFMKTRERNNETMQAFGTYSFSVIKNETYSVQLDLYYDAANNLVGNCFGEPLQEAYILATKCKLIGTWWLCDGPGLEYERQIILTD